MPHLRADLFFDLRGEDMERAGNKLKNDASSLWGGKAGVWDEVVLYYKNPISNPSEEIFQAFLQNTSGQPLYIDNFKVELWRKKH